MKETKPYINFWPSFTDILAALLIIIIIYFIVNILDLRKKYEILGNYEKDRDELIEMIKKEPLLSEIIDHEKLNDKEKPAILLKTDGFTFKINDYQLNKTQIDNIEKLSQIYYQFLNRNDKYKSYSLMIIGHTDVTGPAEYNYELSKNRAESIRQVFFTVLRDRNSYKVFSTGVGEYHLINQNEPESDSNRCIEILLIPEKLIFSKSR